VREIRKTSRKLGEREIHCSSDTRYCGGDRQKCFLRRFPSFDRSSL
jgi:hypothetical protein